MILNQSIQAELIKIRRSGLVWLAILGTLFVNLILALLAVYYPEIFTETYYQDNVWNSWILFHYQGILGLLLPMYLVIISALSIYLENRNETWRLVYGLPVPKYILYLSKLFTVTFIFILSHLLFALLLVSLPGVFRFWADHLSFNYSEIPVDTLMSLFTMTVLSSFGIIGVIFFISYFSRSFIFPLAVGIIGFVLANVLLDASLNPLWFPFAYPALNLSLNNTDIVDSELWIVNLFSVLYYLVFLIAGTYFSKRDTLKTR
jgi:hypothetical protein